MGYYHDYKPKVTKLFLFLLLKCNFIKNLFFIYFVGEHYWFNTSASTVCTMYPVFLVYNEGKLNALGFTFYTESLSSLRFEQVTPDDLKVRWGLASNFKWCPRTNLDFLLHTLLIDSRIHGIGHNMYFGHLF